MSLALSVSHIIPSYQFIEKKIAKPITGHSGMQEPIRRCDRKNHSREVVKSAVQGGSVGKRKRKRAVDSYISLLSKIHLLGLAQSSSVYFTSHGQLAA